MTELTKSQRIVLSETGRVWMRNEQRPGWKAALPIYAFRCPKHGLVENYEQGFEKRLECPKCQEERLPR